MPNWCDNTLTIKGDYKALEKMVEHLEDEPENGLFDYIFPMPDHIRADLELDLDGKQLWYVMRKCTT